MTQRVYLFKGFERFWHWSQATLIIFMIVTGFEIHGSFANFGFERAVNYHTIAARTRSSPSRSSTHRASSRVSRTRSSPPPCKSTTLCSG
jgi:hypothetical protein